MAEITEAALKTEIKSRNFRNVYFLGGRDLYSSEMYAKSIVSKFLDNDNRDMNLHEFDGKYVTPKELSDACESLPFFAEKNVCTVANLNVTNKMECSKEKYDEILKIINNVPEETVLIFYYTSVDICDGKKFPVKEYKRLIDAAAKVGNVCIFPLRTDTENAKITVSLAKKKKCVIGMKEALLLSQKCAGNMYMIDNELEKLAAYSCGRDVTSDMIEELCPGENDAKIYELTGAVANGRKVEALKVYKELCDMKTEPILLLYSIMGSFADYYKVYCAINQGKNAEDIFSDFGVRFETQKRNIRAIFPIVGRMSESDIYKKISLLTECEVKMKTNPQSLHAIILEETIIKML